MNQITLPAIRRAMRDSTRTRISRTLLPVIFAFSFTNAPSLTAIAQADSAPPRQVALESSEDRPKSPLESEIIAKELLTWELEKKKDKQAYAALMAPDFVAITDRGVMNTDLNLKEIDDFEFENYAATDFRVRFITRDAALVTYKVTWKAHSKQKRYEESDYAAAIWAKHGNQWLDAYYQETSVPVPNSTSAPASAQANVPSGFNVSSSSADLSNSENMFAKKMIEKEKASWDFARKRDAVSYAALLGEDFVSVSENGVQDKAYNVNDLKNLTIDQLAFDDFKAHVIGNDMVLLSYKVSATGAYTGKPYASSNYVGSLWTKRKEKWLNIFFQETEATP
jgi:hypothetical protein